jgi:hypothetical protein
MERGLGCLGSWERSILANYPYIIVKLVPHIYQRVIDLASSSFRVFRLAVSLGEILTTAVTSMGSLGWWWFPPRVAIGPRGPVLRLRISLSRG